MIVGQGAAAALIGLASWGSGDLEQRTTRMPIAREHAASRTPLRRTRMLDHARGHPDHPGPSPRRDACLRAGVGARSRAGPSQSPRNIRHVRRDECAPSGRNDLDVARELLREARNWASTSGCRRTVIAGGSRWLDLEAEGDFAGAVDLLDEAERAYVGTSRQTCIRFRRGGHGRGSRKGGSPTP